MLTGKVVVVTGAGRGIGEAVVALSSRFGAKVAACDRIPDGLAGNGAELTAEFDVRDTPARLSFVADVVNRFGRVDVLVNNVRGEMLAAGAAYEPAVVPPLGFMGTADDAAAVAVFLASDMARFVTGTTVHVDGGNWAAGGWRRLEADA